MTILALECATLKIIGKHVRCLIGVYKEEFSARSIRNMEHLQVDMDGNKNRWHRHFTGTEIGREK